jgi:hypothetical protein
MNLEKLSDYIVENFLPNNIGIMLFSDTWI